MTDLKTEIMRREMLDESLLCRGCNRLRLGRAEQSYGMDCLYCRFARLSDEDKEICVQMFQKVDVR